MNQMPRPQYSGRGLWTDKGQTAPPPPPPSRLAVPDAGQRQDPKLSRSVSAGVSAGGAATPFGRFTSLSTAVDDPRDTLKETSNGDNSTNSASSIAVARNSKSYSSLVAPNTNR